jgi:glycosyltransferase involved in cell wall biosynthesis
VHVAFALLTLFPGRVGGSESNVRGLLGEFVRGNGPERVTVLANRHVMKAYGERVGGSVALHHARGYRPGDSAPTRTLAMAGAAVAPGLAARCVPGGVDVIHHPLTVPIPRVPGEPTVATVYDVQHHELPEHFSRAERAFRRWAYDGAARRADLVLTTSDYSRERLVELAGVDPGRVETVRMGIDHERLGPEPGDADERLRARLQLPERYLVYPANLWPHKNHGRLIEALGATGDRDLHLLLSGHDYGRGAELGERARRAGVEDRVRHLGYLEPEEVPALLRGATAMVFPSLYEGFGSPPLEAMACGCPVACSTRGSLAEVIGDAALRFDPSSVEAIAEAIERLRDDAGLCERLRARGLEHASAFSWATAAARHRSLYERAAAMPARSQ